jgi:hypothetical protein
MKKLLMFILGAFLLVIALFLLQQADKKYFGYSHAKDRYEWATTTERPQYKKYEVKNSNNQLGFIDIYPDKDNQWEIDEWDKINSSKNEHSKKVGIYRNSLIAYTVGCILTFIASIYFSAKPVYFTFTRTSSYIRSYRLVPCVI